MQEKQNQLEKDTGTILIYKISWIFFWTVYSAQ